MSANFIFGIGLGIFILIIYHYTEGVSAKASDTDYSPEEITALEEVRKEVEDELEEDFMKTDEYLINFLRAKKLNIPKTAAVIKETMKWWRDNDMTSILEESFPTFEKQYPYKIDFVDKEGRPVILMSFGKWNLRNIIISGQRVQILRYFDQMLQRALDKIHNIRKQTGADVNRFMIVPDMNGYSFTTHGCLNCIPLILDFAKHMETYFAARAIRIYTLNTPRLFIPVFELIKPLLSETTAKGFKIYASNKDEWKAELLKVIPKTELPVEYGGSGKKKVKPTSISTTTPTTTEAPSISTEPPNRRPNPKVTKKPVTMVKPQAQVPADEYYDCEE